MSLKKTISLSICCFVLLPLFLHSQSQKLTINPVIGFRLHTNGLPALRRAGNPLFITAPMLGFDMRLGKHPISLSFQKDWNLRLVPYNDIPNFKSSYSEYWTENNFLLRYNFKKKYRASVGYYLMRREGTAVYLFPEGAVIRDYKGILLGISRQFDWLAIELRTKFVLSTGYFDALTAPSYYSLIFSYRFDKASRAGKSTNKFNKNFQMNALIGSRFFPIKGLKVLPNEEFGKIGIATTIGLELLHKKSQVSLNIEKDFWWSLNGGSPRRDIKGEISTTFLGFKYHIKLKSQKHFRIGLGYSLVRDLDKRALRAELLAAYSSVEDIPTHLEGLYNNQVKGIGFTLSYELFPNTDIEFKHTFPIQSVNEPLFNPIRMSGGIIYRLNKI